MVGRKLLDSLSLQFGRKSLKDVAGTNGVCFYANSPLGVRSTDAAHFADCVVDWVWLPKDDPALFVAGTTPGRAVLPPVWQFTAVRIDFLGG